MILWEILFSPETAPLKTELKASGIVHLELPFPFVIKKIIFIITAITGQCPEHWTRTTLAQNLMHTVHLIFHHTTAEIGAANPSG